MRNILQTTLFGFILCGMALVVTASTISEYSVRSNGIVAAEYDLAHMLGR